MNRRYLIRRGAIWYFRIPVPRSLHHKTTRKEIILSLKTSNYADARILVNHLEARVLKELFPMIQKYKEDKVEVLIKQYLRECIDCFEEIKNTTKSWSEPLPRSCR